MKLCECGCGQETKLASKTSTRRGWVKGQPLKYINGHNVPNKGKVNKLNSVCLECEKPFEHWPSRGNAEFCSHSCAASYNNRKNIAPIGNMRKTSGGYWQIKVENHPFADKNAYVMYHRYLMEQHLGEFISKEYDVHHKDENIYNNDISNLVKITKAEHMRLHARKRIRGAKGYFNDRRVNR